MSGFFDADCGQKRSSRKSVSGKILMCAGSLIHWRSKQQKPVGQSSNESDFVSLAACIRDDLWKMKFLTTMKKVLDSTTAKHIFDIGKDNQACNADSLDPLLSDLSKHIDLKCQFLVDHIGKGDVKLCYVPTEDMAADILTKNWSAQKFGHLMHKSGID